MLTFTPLTGSGVRVAGGPKPVAIFPSKPAAADVNLLVSPEEEFTEGVVSWPGEYDIAGMTVRGIGHLDGQEVSYLLDVDGVRSAFPASPLQEWKDEDIERLGDVHILVLPAENPKASQKLVEDVDPRMLIIVAGKEMPRFAPFTPLSMQPAQITISDPVYGTQIINDPVILEIINTPELIDNSEYPLLMAVGKLRRNLSLCIVYKHIEKGLKIITFFPAKRGRYE
ncbi:hypothetical protein HZA45_00290, partial [Candidatus Peregrinibacteria bacterium]|nr:hypothetical protein [Candidatus Peregrinibacteria bacterium]